MASFFGAGGGKTRSQSGFSGTPLRSLEKNLVSIGGSQQLNNQILQQLNEALRTGGVGAQIPIIQQAVSGANQATSQALRGTESSLASSGLSRTPYGQRILAETRLGGAQAAGRIPTDIAQGFIGQAPQFSQGLLGQILGVLQKTSSKGGAYAT
jgi:hypothetical protein